MRIAVLGPEGTFSDKAYIEYARTSDAELNPVYCSTIDDVFNTVCDVEKECELGIVPIENTLDGYVQRTLDLLLEKDVCVIDENRVEVQFSMIANAARTEDISRLYVQFKANGQCRQFINSLGGVKLVTTESNMESYYSIGKEQGFAAIVPMHIAENESGERMIVHHVTDAKNNHTRFVIFKRGNKELSSIKSNTTGRIRIPVYVMPKGDRPGILYEILKSFNDARINLISIMSRPTRQELGNYNFYMEIEGEGDRLLDIADTLAGIGKLNTVKVIGVYNE